MGIRRILPYRWLFVGICMVGLMAAPAAAQQAKPLMSDFIGINIHTGQIVQTSTDVPTLFAPTTGLVRDYHGFGWDVNTSGETTRFPTDKWSWINWSTEYSKWTNNGIQVNAAIQFQGFYNQVNWPNPYGNAFKYGAAFATAFGPTVGSGVVTSLQIGNEPGEMSDALYREIFRGMAEGIRSVDPAMMIVTCNVADSPSGDYHKDINLLSGLEHLVDAYATHSYPMLTHWPTYRRSFPEDPRLNSRTNPGVGYTASIQAVIDWQKANNPNAQTWVTEFGYDASTKEGPAGGWEGVTDTQQAQYLTRSFLMFSEMDMERAYMFWYNDGDSPSYHASSGLTRNWQPKPSYYAQSHLMATLGDYYFSEVVREDGTAYVYAYAHKDNADDQIWVLWSPTGDERTTLISVDIPGTPGWAEMMPLAAGAAPLVDYDVLDGGTIQLLVGESPTYLSVIVPEPATMSVLGLGALAMIRRRR